MIIAETIQTIKPNPEVAPAKPNVNEEKVTTYVDIIMVITIYIEIKIAAMPPIMRSAFDAFFIYKTSSLILSN